MSYIIRPSEYNVPAGARITFHDKEKKYIYKTIPVEDPYKEIRVEDKLINENVERFIYKFQKRGEKTWEDINKYSLLVQKNDLGKFWTDEIVLKETEIYNLINFYTNDKNERAYFELRRNFKKVCEDLWLNHNSTHNNLRKYIKFTKSTNTNFSKLWQNLNLYLEYTLRLKQTFRKHKINRHFYNELNEEGHLNEDSDISRFLLNEISALKNSDLQFSYILIGQYYSLLGDRLEATENFETAVKYKTDWETHFLIGQGAPTYKIPHNQKEDYNNIQMLSGISNIEANTTILISVDIKYLRYYVVSLLYNSIALKKYHFHVHVIGDTIEAVEAITKAKNIYNDILAFSEVDKNSNHPTFSFENNPDFSSSIRTYSACARFVNATWFMELFNTNLMIVDGDMFITDNPQKYLTIMNKFDVGVAFSRGITPAMPWRRLMAGNLFLKNNEKAKSFINYASLYIIEAINQEHSWTLDQNALSYAYDQVMKKYPDIKIENTYKHKTPVSHPPIRKLIESQ